MRVISFMDAVISLNADMFKIFKSIGSKRNTSMIVDGTYKLYKSYLMESNSKWDYANSILYSMCNNNPKHTDEHIIVGKIWLIGRSYAAAIERRNNATDNNDDFYYEVVAPKMLSIGKELDDRLSTIREGSDIDGSVAVILSTHKFLTDVFYELTGLEKRSLASKYLHFHCPDKFFIYDSRARASVGKLVKEPDKNVIDGLEYDPEYGDFVCRMLELQRYLKDKIGACESPRKIDNFLLNAVK